MVRISTTLGDAQPVSRAEGEGTPATYTGTSLSLSVDYGEGDKYTRTNILWNNTTGAWAQDLTAAADPMLWKNSKTPAQIYAFAPHVSKAYAIDLTAVPFSVKEDQSAAGAILASDLVGYAKTDFVPGSSLDKLNALNIAFTHRLSKLTVNLTYGNQYPDNAGKYPAIEKLEVMNTYLSATYNARTLAATVLTSTETGTKTTVGSIKAATTATTAEANSYEAILVPQTVDASTKLVLVTLTDGTKLAYTTPAPQRFEANKHYTLSLRIGKNKLEVGSVTVGEWGNGTPITGGEAKPLSIKYNATSQVLEIASASGLRLLGCMGIATPTDTELSAANLTMEQYKAMKALAKANNYSAVLTSDIDLSEYDSWLSIGVLATEYKGVFDGQGHSISGLKSDANTDYNTHDGLFGSATGATFRNLTIVAPTMVTFSQGGALVGKATACTISNCKVTDVNITGSQKTGALIGEMSGECLVEDCYSSGKITGVSRQNSVLGGLIGAATGTVRRCGSTVEISAPSMQQIGGLAGSAYACSLVACYAKGDVEGNMTVGGLVGSMSGAVNITGCYATGSVTANHYSGALTGSYNGSTAHVTGFYYRGASNNIYLVGEAYVPTTVMKIKYCASRSSKGPFGSNTTGMKPSDTSLFIGNQFNTALTFTEIRDVVASTQAQSVWDEVEPDASYVDGYNLSGGNGKNSFWIENADASLKLWWEQ